MYGNQVQGRKVAGSSKQATVGDSGLTLQNTVDDVKKHLISPTSFPGSFISPPQRERGKKDPGSGWSRVLVTNLSSREWSQFIKVLSPRPFVAS